MCLFKYLGKCRPGEFECLDGSNCVPQSGLCDFFPDCIDQSDEGDICNSKGEHFLAWDYEYE